MHSFGGSYDGVLICSHVFFYSRYGFSVFQWLEFSPKKVFGTQYECANTCNHIRNSKQNNNNNSNCHDKWLSTIIHFIFKQTGTLISISYFIQFFVLFNYFMWLCGINNVSTECILYTLHHEKLHNSLQLRRGIIFFFFCSTLHFSFFNWIFCIQHANGNDEHT